MLLGVVGVSVTIALVVLCRMKGKFEAKLVDAAGNVIAVPLVHRTSFARSV